MTLVVRPVYLFDEERVSFDMSTTAPTTPPTDPTPASGRRAIAIDTVLAAAAALLALLTLVVPEWIEVVFRVDPDAGSGALEWIVAVTCCLAAVALGVRARRRLRYA